MRVIVRLETAGNEKEPNIIDVRGTNHTTKMAGGSTPNASIVKRWSYHVPYGQVVWFHGLELFESPGRSFIFWKALIEYNVWFLWLFGVYSLASLIWTWLSCFFSWWLTFCCCVGQQCRYSHFAKVRKSKVSWEHYHFTLPISWGALLGQKLPHPQPCSWHCADVYGRWSPIFGESFLSCQIPSR